MKALPSVELRPTLPEYAELWLSWRQEAMTIRHNPLLSSCASDLATRLAECGQNLADPAIREYRWMVWAQGQIVGTVAIEQPNWRMGYAEIGYMIGEQYAGRGYGTAAVAQLIDKLFRETDLQRVIATISVENIASCRLVERLGFTREGLLRDHYIIQGRRVDEYIYGLLRREWVN